jgi:hypothetical protein
VLRALPLAVASAAFASAAHAEPGTHAPSISTWDTRASSVNIGFRPGFLGGGHFDIVSYYASFSSTTGNLSSQFGIHYLNVRTGPGESVNQGLGATAVALFSIPFTPRYDTGVPKGAVGLYLGASPTALVSGRASYVSVPFVLGIGLPYSPAKVVTITPWFEASPGVNLDTRVRESTLSINPSQFTSNGTSVNLTDANVRQLLNSAVDFQVKGTVGLRTGLDLAVRLADSVDFNLNGMLGSLGGGFGGTFVGWVGGGFTFRWDKVVPAVLPAERRLENEDCGDIGARYRACQTIEGPNQTPVPGIAPLPAPAPSPAYPPYTPPPAPQPSPSSTVPSAALPPAPAPAAAPSPAPAPEETKVPTTAFPQ